MLLLDDNTGQALAETKIKVVVGSSKVLQNRNFLLGIVVFKHAPLGCHVREMVDLVARPMFATMVDLKLNAAELLSEAEIMMKIILSSPLENLNKNNKNLPY